MSPRTVWIIVRTKTNRERYAEQNVIRHAKAINLKVATFLPRVELNHHGKEELLFPGYLFVNTPGQWRFLENTFGCGQVIKFGENAGHVPHKVIRELRAHVKAKKLPKWRKPKAGETVKILKGPYANLLGLYQGQSKLKRACILLDFMSKQVPLEVDARDLIPVAA